ncbi:DNA processing protein [Crossiella equi]|uniref:DNA processing protein n=1 Tax=Crossiella equi TaxID=130796 RepID=A0ABS5AG93_9PSEU|nr:DNA-processing protein DprA [Crossiella equi]MBP2475604.1 DNA processing protein [Crossiella equi]
MTDRREQAALLLALRDSGRSWADVAQVVEEAGSASAVLDSLLTPVQPTLDYVERDLDTELAVTEREIESWTAEGIRLVTLLDADYPAQLMLVHQRPPFLTYRGSLDPLDKRSVAVVGSRAASATGQSRARDLTSELCNAGWTVVSGLAAGIDTAVHQAALDAGSRTVAVIGTGLRRCYPQENSNLQDQISRTGAVLSQFWPDTGPAKHHFPMRNAVMSGYVTATVVVEASEHSGARIQARVALEHGRHVFLAPEVVHGTNWGQEMAKRPNTTVLENPNHVLKVLDELTADLPDLIQL